MLGTTLPAMAILGTEGTAITLTSGFLGTAMLAGVYLSIGLLVSSLASTQTVAYLGAFGANLGIWSVDRLADAVGPWGQTLAGALSVQRRMAAFHNGAPNLSDILYLASWILLAVFLASRALDARRWA